MKELTNESIDKLAKQYAEQYIDSKDHYYGFIAGFEKSQENTKPLLEQIAELKQSYKFLEAKYGALVSERKDNAIDGQAALDEANNRISDLQFQLKAADSDYQKRIKELEKHANQMGNSIKEYIEARGSISDTKMFVSMVNYFESTNPTKTK